LKVKVSTNKPDISCNHVLALLIVVGGSGGSGRGGSDGGVVVVVVVLAVVVVFVAAVDAPAKQISSRVCQREIKEEKRFKTPHTSKLFIPGHASAS
jgi:hypothetical protein